MACQGTQRMSALTLRPTIHKTSDMTTTAESVWDYPRPPALVSDTRRILVRFDGITIADSVATYRVLETSHPPVFYIPASDTKTDLLIPSSSTTFCEFKGHATYWSIRSDQPEAHNCAWSYRSPSSSFTDIADHFAFYPSRMEECSVDGEIVQSQKGDFYGGWITSEIQGPFKGGAGTWGW